MKKTMTKLEDKLIEYIKYKGGHKYGALLKAQILLDKLISFEKNRALKGGE